MKRIILLPAAILMTLAAMTLFSCGDNNPLAPEVRGANEIWIQNSEFVPDRLTVPVGTTVKWVNKDDTPHTVDSGTPRNPVTNGFSSPVLEKKNMSFSWTFDTKGTFSYFCSIHSEQGQVIVQ